MLRPRVSTSGGQSFGGGLRVAFLVWEAQEAKEVQERQLEGRSVEVGGFLGGRACGGLTACRPCPGRRLWGTALVGRWVWWVWWLWCCLVRVCPLAAVLRCRLPSGASKRETQRSSSPRDKCRVRNPENGTR